MCNMVVRLRSSATVLSCYSYKQETLPTNTMDDETTHLKFGLRHGALHRRTRRRAASSRCGGALHQGWVARRRGRLVRRVRALQLHLHVFSRGWLIGFDGAGSVLTGLLYRCLHGIYTCPLVMIWRAETHWRPAH